MATTKKKYAAPRYKAFLSQLGSIGSFVCVKEVTEDLGELSGNLISSFDDIDFPFDTFISQGTDVNVAENDTTGWAGFASDQSIVTELDQEFYLEFDYRVESGSGSVDFYIGTAAVGTAKSNKITATTDGHYSDILTITAAGTWYLVTEVDDVIRFNVSNITLKKKVDTTYKAFKFISVSELKALLGI